MRKFCSIPLLLLSFVAVFSILNSNAKVPHVYINPGHGGHDSDDRNVRIPPFAPGDTMGFWESNSNMWKGFALKEILEKKGYKTSISRVKNETSDDLPLSTIVRLSNNSGADVFYSIHSNASGYGDPTLVNFPMGFYRGYTGQPVNVKSQQLLLALAPHIINNTSTVWSQNSYAEYGDWTFHSEWGTQGFGVLRGNNIPSMLDEGSFHDYYPEAYRLINHEYCWVEGFSFSLGADAYFGRLDQYDKGLITGTIRDDRLLRTDILRMLGADKRCAVNQAVAKLIDAGGNVLDTYQCDTIRNGIYLFKYVDPGTYTVEVSHHDYFTQTAQVVVNANAKTYQNFDLKRVRNTPPEVIKYSPMWNEGDPEILCSSSVVLDFNWDMDTESVEEAFSVEPALEGMFKWEDANYRMIFTPNDAFEANTLYTIRLGKEAMHGGGTPMVEDFEFTVRTTARKHLNTLAMFPDEGDEVHYKAGAFIEFRTDSLLDGHDLFTRFHVYDSEGTELDFNKRNIKNNKKGDPYGYIRLPLLKALNPGDAYKVVLDREVCDTVGVHLPSQLTFNFTAIDAAQIPEGATIVDGFESVAMEVDDDVSANVKSAALSASTEKLEGSKSLQLKYEFLTPNEGKIRLAYPAPEGAPMLYDASAMEFVNGDELGLSICGDMSYNRVVGIFAAGGEEIAVPLSKLTYHGWRTVSVKLEGLSGDMPYELVGLELENGGTVMGASGTIRFDQLTRVPTSGIDERTVAGVHVGPNPANEYLVASADSYISGVELLDANGRVITRHNGNFINVSGIATGVYFMRVWVNGMPSTHKVMVKH